MNPFVVNTEPARPSELSRSFFLNGTICRDIVEAKPVGKTFVWNRYYSNKSLPNPVSESANLEVSLFARLQEVIGKMLSSTIEESVPATTLRLKENDMMLLSFIHDSSDWVVTFDKIWDQSSMTFHVLAIRMFHICWIMCLMTRLQVSHLT